MLQKFYLSLIVLVFVIPFCWMDSVMEMIESEDYPAEKHDIHTRDGYILTVYRIPNMKNVQQKKRKVVLFMHGMVSAAPAFITFGRKKSSAYKFSDAGYDVWIGNARGNTYSRHHITMSPDDPKFWDFSWHEIGVYDLPATIDYILNATNQTKLSYVGHSQGVTVVFALLSELPEYNDKISVVHAMTPSVIIKYKHPLLFRGLDVKTVNSAAKWLYSRKMYELASHAGMSSKLASLSRFCLNPTGREVCRSIVYMVMGPSNHYFDAMLKKSLNHLPAGASYKQLAHYGQITASGKFQQYHHGIKKNMEIYGTLEPPPYNLSNVRTNIHIMYGTNDWLTPSKNVPLLAKALGRYPFAISKFPGFNHVDFAYASNLDLVHRKIFKVEKLYDQQISAKTNRRGNFTQIEGFTT